MSEIDNALLLKMDAMMEEMVGDMALSPPTVGKQRDSGYISNQSFKRRTSRTPSRRLSTLSVSTLNSPTSIKSQSPSEIKLESITQAIEELGFNEVRESSASQARKKLDTSLCHKVQPASKALKMLGINDTAPPKRDRFVWNALKIFQSPIRVLPSRVKRRSSSIGSLTLPEINSGVALSEVFEPAAILDLAGSDSESDEERIPEPLISLNRDVYRKLSLTPA